jgi:hypothetical protein
MEKINIDLLMSQAWHNLTLKQKELYLYCVAESKDNCEYFEFNKSKWNSIYGLYTDSGQRHFYKDMKALVENGFVEIVKSGKTTREKNIYRCIDRWVNLGVWNIKNSNGKKVSANYWGYVYIVKMGKSYKIGTSKTPRERLKEFTKLPEPIEDVFIKKVCNYKAIEEELHNMYNEKRIRGEWFRLNSKDISKIISFLESI